MHYWFWGIDASVFYFPLFFFCFLLLFLLSMVLLPLFLLPIFLLYLFLTNDQGQWTPSICIHNRETPASGTDDDNYNDDDDEEEDDDDDDDRELISSYCARLARVDYQNT